MKTLAAVCMASFLTMAGSGLAADEQEDPWRFGVTVPLWAAGIDGDVTLRGVTKDVSISFDQLKDHLDAAFSIGVEARKERFGFYAGVGYMKFEFDGAADGTLKFLIGDLGVAYRLVKSGEERPFILEAIGGIRYWHVNPDITIKGPRGVALFHGESNYDLYDPVIGLRGSKFLGRKWHLDFQADVGGFGIADKTSDLDWSATGVMTYDFCKWFSFSAGYKALSVKIENGSGTEKRGVDITMHGLLIAAKLTF